MGRVPLLIQLRNGEHILLPTVLTTVQEVGHSRLQIRHPGLILIVLRAVYLKRGEDN